MLKLFWNADSPYCRIVLWHIAATQRHKGVVLKHLSWEEIRATASGGRLGLTATVPCLELEDGTIIPDSFRILAYFLNDRFALWLLSEDGEFYRHIEGQLSRVMYGLYDHPSSEVLKKVEARWNLVLKSAELYFSTRISVHDSAPEPPSLALQALHIFVQFCLHFQPDWHRSIPTSIAQILLEAENKKGFDWFKNQLTEQAATVAIDHLPSSTELQGFSG